MLTLGMNITQTILQSQYCTGFFFLPRCASQHKSDSLAVPCAGNNKINRQESVHTANELKSFGNYCYTARAQIGFVSN